MGSLIRSNYKVPVSLLCYTVAHDRDLDVMSDMSEGAVKLALPINKTKTKQNNNNNGTKIRKTSCFRDIVIF